MDSHKSRFTFTAHLFTLIDNLPAEKQFILYKQLIKDNINTALFKLIIDMSEEEKTRLLMQLETPSDEYEPLQTIDLDADESFMRENPRKICSIAVNCRIEDRSFESYIIDISKLGVFIDSNDLFPEGQKILLNFKLPDFQKDFQLDGRIARSGPRGIGVKFSNVSPEQEAVILKFIERQK